MSKDKLLFTPGPLTTGMETKEAMLRDLGSRDAEFIETIKGIRNDLLALGGVSKKDGFEAILMQGSGTFGIEAVISSAVPTKGCLLNIINGAYGKRIQAIAEVHKINNIGSTCDEDEIPDMVLVEETLKENPYITHISMVHCETTTGIFNPLEPLGKLAKKYNKILIVDAMSSFGAVPIDMAGLNIDFLISSSNKCIEGVPGFSFILAKRDSLLKCKGVARTLSLDVYAQWEGLEQNGQFRFTPPTHSMLAFAEALTGLKLEGGVEGRARRYQQNHATLMEGMNELGFQPYLKETNRGYIITSFLYPGFTGFNFTAFYNKLNDRGFVIYPGKLSDKDCFRIGNIGQITPLEMKALLSAIKDVLNEMQ